MLLAIQEKWWGLLDSKAIQACPPTPPEGSGVPNSAHFEPVAVGPMPPEAAEMDEERRKRRKSEIGFVVTDGESSSRRIHADADPSAPVAATALPSVGSDARGRLVSEGVRALGAFAADGDAPALRRALLRLLAMLET